MSETQFTPARPTNPAQPDFISEGKLLHNVAVLAGASVTSKSIQIMVNTNESGMKTLYVYSDQAGTVVIQLLMDETEMSGGAPVWRNLTDPASPITVTKDVLMKVDILSLIRQLRIVFKNTSGTASTANAWVFSAA